MPRGVQSALISPAEDHVRASTSPSGGCRRTAGSPSTDPRPHGRPADRHAADGVGREDRAAGARHRRHRPRPEQARLHRRTTTTGSPTSFTKPHGMVLVTGPTGSGKSTTLYATLAEISKPEVNIITVEDPVEYRLRGVNQVQVNHKAGLTFAAVLPAILRSDPDVVLIGEIRDGVTAQLAVEAVAHRPPRALDAAHQRRARRGHPADRDGHRAVPGRLVAGLRAGPAARPPAVRLVQGGVRADRGGAGRRALAVRGPRARRRSCGGRSAAATAPTPATAAGSRCTR